MPKKLKPILERLEPHKFELLYIGTIYWDDDPKIRQQRYELVTALARKLLVLGHSVFSPVTHGHAIATSVDNWPRIDWLEQVDLPVLRKCKVLIALKLPGWERSNGLEREISIARYNKKPVFYISQEEAEALPCK